MGRIRGVVVIAVAVMLVGCSGQDGQEEQAGRASVEAMLEVEQVPGVLVAPYEYLVQIDPDAPEDEIVATALAVRDIVDEMSAGRPRELDIVAVYPGDPYVKTQFNAFEYDDRARFAHGVRLWAGLLDEGFTEVSYTMAKEGVGPGALAVHAQDPDTSAKTMAEAYAAMQQALSEAPDADAQPSLYAAVDGVSILNKSGRRELPEGWIEVAEGLESLEYLTSSAVRIHPSETWVALIGDAELTVEQTEQIMAVLTDSGVLQPSVKVVYTNFAALPKDGKTMLFGAAE